MRRPALTTEQCAKKVAASPLSPTMLEAIEFAKSKGGYLVRHPGGFWAGEDWTYHSKSFATTTIQAIVARGAGQYTDWKYGSRGPGFPIKMTLTD